MGTDAHLIEYEDMIDPIWINEAISDLKRLEKEGKEVAANIKKAFEKTKPFDIKGMEKLEGEVKKATLASANLAKAQKAANKVKKASIELTNEQLIQQQKEKLAHRDRVARAKQAAIISREEKNNIASLRAQLSLATLDWKKLTAAEATNTAEGRKLVSNKKSLTKQLKKLEEATDDHRRSVGKYSKGMKGLRKTLLRVFVGRTILDGVARLGGAFKGLVDDFRGSNEKIEGVGKSFDKVTGALQFAGVKILEFLAPAIEVVANALAKLPAFFAGISAGASQLATNVGAQFRKMGLNIELVFAKINQSNPFTGKTAEELEQKVKDITSAIETQTNTQRGVAKAYKDAYDAVIIEQEAFVKKQEETAKAAQRKQLATELAAIKAAEQKKIEIRLKAIIQLQLLLQNAEIANIKDREERLLALEEQRFVAEQQLAISRFKELEKLFEDAEKDTTEIKVTNDKLKEEQEIKHQENLANIRKEFTDAQRQEAKDNLRQIREDRIAEEERVSDSLDEQRDSAKERLREQREDRQEAEADQLAKDLENNKKREEANKQLLSNISKSAQKVGELIGDLFQKQADLAGERVTEQESNLENAEERQRQGLETNLSFEREQLAKRQSEQQAKQKEAENAAKILTLFNLVSAYAQSGDENALTRGLVDFAFLTAISAGFEEGGYTGEKGKKAVAGFVHGQEYVVTAADTKKWGLTGKTGSEFGEAISDNFPTQTPTTINPFPEQERAFKQNVEPKSNNQKVVAEIQGLRKDLANQPNYSAQIVEVQKGLHQFVLTENKKNMKKIKKEYIRAKN